MIGELLGGPGDGILVDVDPSLNEYCIYGEPQLCLSQQSSEAPVVPVRHVYRRRSRLELPPSLCLARACDRAGFDARTVAANRQELWEYQGGW